MINSPTNAGSAEVTPIDTNARWPLLLLLGSGLTWLVISGVFALIASIQLHTPQFLTDCALFTHGRVQAMRESAFVYGWAANAGLAIALWVLARLGGNALRAGNWVVAGTLFWNLGLLAGLVGIAVGDMTSFALLQLPTYVQPLMLFSYATIAIAGVLAWGGRRTDGTYASQWYAVAGLFVFPWLFSAAQVMLFSSPVRGTVQAITAGWFAQGAWTLWLAPLALAGAYYIVPKTAGRVLPSYDFASLGFWTLLFVGAWTGGRHLIGGPVPAWVSTVGIVAAGLLLFHYLIVFLNLRVVTSSEGNAAAFVRIGIIVYLLVGVLDMITSFRAIAVQTQFTFLATALEQLGLYGAISMMFFGAIYYMVPRVVGAPWASGAMVSGHRVIVILGILMLVGGLTAAGMMQAGDLLNSKAAFADIIARIRTPLLIVTGAQMVLITANLLLLVNFLKTATANVRGDVRAQNLFRQPSVLEASAT